MTQHSPWETDKEGFLQARRDNEYAEYLLSSGDVLVTDWESPIYILIENDYPDEQSVDDALYDAIGEDFGVWVECFELDNLEEGIVYPIWEPSGFL